MEIFESIVENSQLPILTAFILGLMTAISPCPLATNITAIGYISKDIQNKRKVFYNGIIYTLGRALTYTLIGVILYFTAGSINISGSLQMWGEKLLGPILIIIGLFMLGVIKVNIPGLSNISEKLGNKSKGKVWDVLLLGVVFALAFCPYSGVLYFGMLIPITVASAKGLYLPLVFAIATGIPVILFAWIIAFSVGSIGKLYNNMKVFEVWFRRVIAVLFTAIGAYYTYTILVAPLFLNQ
jgi:sulfite exporter TauE/SafE